MKEAQIFAFPTDELLLLMFPGSLTYRVAGGPRRRGLRAIRGSPREQQRHLDSEVITGANQGWQHTNLNATAQQFGGKQQVNKKSICDRDFEDHCTCVQPSLLPG